MSKREPEKVWKALVKEAADDEAAFQRAAGATAEEVDRSLAASGLDPEAERAAAGDFRREIEQRVALRKARETEEKASSRSTRPRPASRPVVWLVAATVGAAVGGGLVYAATHRAPPPPAPAPPAPSAPPSAPEPPEPVVPDLVAASTLRQDAVAACDARDWSTCLARLDRARALDADGDDTPLVKKTRKRAIDGILGDKPH